MPLLVMGVAARAGHLDLATGFDWIGTTEAIVAFSAAAALEIGAYLIPFVDNALDVFAAPAATVAGTVLMASSVVDVSPFLQWTLAIVAGGGVAGTVQLFTSATRIGSTATTGALANPAVSTVEAGGSAGLSTLAIAAPLVAAVLVIALVYVALRSLSRVRWRRGIGRGS